MLLDRLVTDEEKQCSAFPLRVYPEYVYVRGQDGRLYELSLCKSNAYYFQHNIHRLNVDETMHDRQFCGSPAYIVVMPDADGIPRRRVITNSEILVGQYLALKFDTQNFLLKCNSWVR